VADAFNTLISARDKISPAKVVHQIVVESGLSYDPQVVNALATLWKRNELGFASVESKGEITMGVPSE